MRQPARFLPALALGVASVIFGSPSRAIPITYVEQAIATGSLGGVSFTSANVVLSMTDDTTNVTGGPTIFFNFGTVTVNVTDIGLATITDATSIAANHSALNVGFGDARTGSAILFAGSPLISSYDLTTAIGPLLGTASYNAGLPFPTTDGLFVLNDIPDSVTFIATTDVPAVPEPAAFVLLSVGLAGLAGFGLIRHRRGSAARRSLWAQTQG